MSRLVRPPAAIDYPSSDGKPLAENDAQLHAILYAVGVLGQHYAERPDVYVSGDLLIYYKEGNPRVSVAPDAFVVFGIEDRVRMNYKVWEEGKGPDFVLEVASPNTWRVDVERKPAVYAGLGVLEYFLFDPLGEHLAPRLQGHRLVDGAYERLAAVESIDRTLTLTSEVLGLELRAKPGGGCAFTTRPPVGTFSATRRRTPRGEPPRRGPSGKPPPAPRPRCGPSGKPPPARPPRRGSRSSRHACGTAADAELSGTGVEADRHRVAVAPGRTRRRVGRATLVPSLRRARTHTAGRAGA